MCQIIGGIMKKTNKIAVIITMVIMLIMGAGNFSNASSQQGSGLSGIYQTSQDDKSAYDAIGGKIVGIVQFICYAAAVIILLYKGVGLMNKAPEAKADAKKELIAYAVGAFILFGIGSIIRIIANIAMNKLF